MSIPQLNEKINEKGSRGPAFLNLSENLAVKYATKSISEIFSACCLAAMEMHRDSRKQSMNMQTAYHKLLELQKDAKVAIHQRFGGIFALTIEGCGSVASALAAPLGTPIAVIGAILTGSARAAKEGTTQQDSSDRTAADHLYQMSQSHASQHGSDYRDGNQSWQQVLNSKEKVHDSEDRVVQSLFARS